MDFYYHLSQRFIRRKTKVRGVRKLWRTFRNQTPNLNNVIVLGIVGGIIMGILIDVSLQNTNVVEARSIEEAPREVRLEVIIDWTPERIEEEIRNAFPEAPNTAIAIAKCESGLRADIQSQHILHYGQEESFGLFQIHARDHDRTARRLGLENYKTDIKENIAMARFLYDSRGNFRDWTCYKSGAYKSML